MLPTEGTHSATTGSHVLHAPASIPFRRVFLSRFIRSRAQRVDKSRRSVQASPRGGVVASSLLEQHPLRGKPSPT